MAIFRVQIFKQLTGSDREWSNTYLCEAPDLATVEAVLPTVCDSEAQAFRDNVTVTRARASDTEPDTDVFAVFIANVIGSHGSSGDGAWLPLFNTVRVDINVDGGGRPSRKYYRPPILESEQQSGFLDPAVMAYFETVVGQLITDFSTGSCPLVDPDGQTLVTPSTFAKVQMRQLHRKRRKAVTP
jgi:hypothetical protein